jgi:hypothetical protein
MESSRPVHPTTSGGRPSSAGGHNPSPAPAPAQLPPSSPSSATPEIASSLNNAHAAPFRSSAGTSTGPSSELPPWLSYPPSSSESEGPSPAPVPYHDATKGKGPPPPLLPGRRRPPTLSRSLLASWPMLAVDRCRRCSTQSTRQLVVAATVRCLPGFRCRPELGRPSRTFCVP